MHKLQIKEGDVFSMSMSECSVCELYTRVPVSNGQLYLYLYQYKYGLSLYNCSLLCSISP